MNRHRELAQMMRTAAEPPDPDAPLIWYPCQTDNGSDIFNEGAGGAMYDLTITGDAYSYGTMPNGETGILQTGGFFEAATSVLSFDMSAGATICALVQVNQYVNTAIILGYGDTVGPQIAVRTVANNLQALVRNSSGDASGVVTVPTTSTVTKHIAYTYALNGTARFYVNGAESLSGSAGDPGSTFSGDVFRVGFAPEEGGIEYNGSYNDLRFYERVLSPAEIAAIAATHTIP